VKDTCELTLAEAQALLHMLFAEIPALYCRPLLKAEQALMAKFQEPVPPAVSQENGVCQPTPL
jgi:hypothetical protein